MKKWNLATAVDKLTENKDVEVDIIRKTINAPKGFNGLKSCSAFDYLTTVHKYNLNK